MLGGKGDRFGPAGGWLRGRAEGAQGVSDRQDNDQVRSEHRKAVDSDIEAGRTVVCNVSRTVVGAVRGRYANVVTVLVTAPQDVLRSRLAARERASDGRVSDRMRRLELPDGKLRPDVIINNVGDPQSEGRKLVDTLYASGALA